MNGGQITPWTQLPKSKPSALQFHGLDTDKARRAILRLKKIDTWVERWAQLEISLSSASALAKLEISLDSTSHLPQLAISGVQVDDVDPTITIDLTGDTFLSEAAAENAANWTFDAATSGLTFGAITYVDPTQVTIATTGTALAGLFGVLAKATCLTGGVLSGVATYDIDAETSSCTDPLVDPVLAVVLTDDTFASEALIEDVANWTFGLGTSGLTITSVTYVDGTHCTIETSGIAAETTITAMIELAALTAGTYDSAVCTYNLATDASTTPDPLVDPVLAVELTLDTFKSEVLIEDVANWTFALGTSGLTIVTVTYVDDENCTIETSGIAAETTITAMIEKAALTLGLYDSGVCTYNLGTAVSTCTSDPEVFVKTAIAAASEDPTLRIVLNDDAWASKADCEDVTNWTVDEGDTDLTFTGVTYINERTADLTFTGTAAAGTIAVDIAADATILGTTPSLSTDVDDTAWARSYTSSDFTGTIQAYQWFPRGSDEAGYVGAYTPPQDSNHHPFSHIDLVGDGDFSPRLASAFYYKPHATEGTDYTIWAQLLLDLG